MADFYAPQFNAPPNLVQSYLQGQMAPMQIQAGQQQLQQGQQSLQSGALNIDQLRLALQSKQLMNTAVQQELARQQSAQGGAQSAGGPSGGIQNGPQGSVSATDSSQPSGTPSSSGSYDGSVGGYSPNFLTTMSALQGGAEGVLKTSTGIQDYQLKQRQLQVQGPMSLADTVASSPQADVLVKNNPSLQQQWIQLAPKLGLNPFTDLTPANARSVARYGYNQLAGSAGLPPKEMPSQLQDVSGPYGQQGQRDLVTNKYTQTVARDLPTATPKEITNPDQTTTLVTVPTGGLDASGKPIATTGPAAAGGGGGVNLGYGKASDPELKAAMFGSEMRSGMNTLNKLEGQGFSLSPTMRATIINAATSEDPGALSQLASQEMLVHGMSKNDQTYVAALMPMLQAAGHDQSGARLTTAQIRQNVESLLPVDVRNKDALNQVQQNRTGFYNGLLTQAGPAAHLPQYQNTLGADLQKAQGASSTRTIGGKTYSKMNGKWYAN